MDKLAATAILSTLTACAAPHAPQDFDFSGLSASGMIESVREVPDHRHAFHDAMEHRINPDVAKELVIRLDDGRALTLREKHPSRFAAGQRVRVLANGVAVE